MEAWVSAFLDTEEATNRHLRPCDKVFVHVEDPFSVSVEDSFSVADLLHVSASGQQRLAVDVVVEQVSSASAAVWPPS